MTSRDLRSSAQTPVVADRAPVRGRLSRGDKLSESVCVRLTFATRAKLLSAARTGGLHPAEMVRRLIERELEPCS